MITTFELKPYMTGCKSFGGKAEVTVSTNSGLHCSLFSFDTIIASYWENNGYTDVMLYTLEEKYLSQTTVKHFKAFLGQLFDSVFLIHFEEIIKAYNAQVTREFRVKSFKDVLRKLSYIKLYKIDDYVYTYCFSARNCGGKYLNVKVKFSCRDHCVVE